MSKFVKNPDEIVLENVRMLHYETMEEALAADRGDFECPPCNDLACADHLTDE